MKTQCCNYPIDPRRPVVMWNEGNGAVQCHNCGRVYQAQPPAPRAAQSGASAEQGLGLAEFSREYALGIHRCWRQELAQADRGDLEALAMLLIQKRAVDGVNGRRWDGGAHLYFDLAADSMLARVRHGQGLGNETAETR